MFLISALHICFVSLLARQWKGNSHWLSLPGVTCSTFAVPGILSPAVNTDNNHLSLSLHSLLENKIPVFICCLRVKSRPIAEWPCCFLPKPISKRLSRGLSGKRHRISDLKVWLLWHFVLKQHVMHAFW